jgi:hypothetical protein
MKFQLSNKMQFTGASRALDMQSEPEEGLSEFQKREMAREQLKEEEYYFEHN